MMRTPWLNSRALVGAALSTTLLLATGCFAPSNPTCAFRCGGTHGCPDDYECRMADGYCHLKGSTGPCSFAPQDLIVAGDTAGGDLLGSDAIGAPDMTSVADLTGADMIKVPDMVSVPDLRPDMNGADLTVLLDMSVVPDMQSDFSANLDMTSLPDIQLDQASVPDLRADMTPVATLTTNQNVRAVGAMLGLIGTNFGANEVVNLAVGGQPTTTATVTADGTGAFNVMRAIAANATQGVTTATATGVTTSRMASASVTLIRQCGVTATDRCVFVTSTTSGGNLGGLSGADTTCATRATAVGLTGTFKAWLSTSGTTADSRMTGAALPYVRLDNTTVAASYSALKTPPLGQPINVTELRGAYGGPVWTDTAGDGTSSGASDCATWTSNANGMMGGQGTTTSATVTWTANGADTCDMTKALYCIEQ